MADLFDAKNFHLQWLSVPYLLATAGLVAIGLYALLINGARLLRASFLLCCLTLALVTGSYMLIAGADSPRVAIALHHMAAAMMPLTATGILAFVIIHLDLQHQYGWVAIVSLLTSLVQMPLSLLTDWYVAGVRPVSMGLYHVEAGPLLPVQFISVFTWMALGGWLAYKQLHGVEPHRRRQLTRLLLAFAIFAASAVDIPLAYGLGSYPLSWLFAVIGTAVLFRAMMTNDLIHARSLDYQVSWILAYMVVAVVGLVLVWWLADGHVWLIMLLSVVVYLALRIGIAFLQMESRTQDVIVADTPRERLLGKYASSVQVLASEEEIAEATSETIGLGLGCKDIDLIVLSAHDWSWKTVDGEVLSEDASPDPLTSAWLMDHAQPLQRLDLPGLGIEDFRDHVELLMDANAADVLVPLVNRDEILGILILGQFPSERLMTKEELGFLSRIQEHLTSAFVYARMHQEANARVAMQKEVALAAAIQKAFVSSADLIDCGDIQVSGLWAPATQCGGDWWSVHELPDRRVLVLVGDVTGHGVAAAMVTAAAKGCYDVVQRLMGNKLDVVDLLRHLDATVRLVGARHFHMTCSATLLDPDNGTVTYANAGHVAPYVCSPKPGGGTKLGALVARGNPLGAGHDSVYKSRVRPLERGDILVWYTDGLVECTNLGQKQFGDRRMQRLLRKIDQWDPNARSVRDNIIRAVAAFQGDQPPDDDITLVIARVAGEPARA